MNSIAFLLLTYGDHVKADYIQKYLSNGNIYVHPKNKSDVKSFLKNHIIDNNVKTEWGKCSIVKAELELLKESYKNTNNKWFILMSDKCLPIVDYNTLYKKLNEINKSNFHLTGYFNIPSLQNFSFYKSSQFWILERNDVSIILNKYSKYLKIIKDFEKEIYHHSACDEAFFLTLLINENPNYDFYNIRSTYSRWIYLTKNSHPFIFNKITSFDIKDLIDNKSFFIRKITNNFTLNNIKPKNNLIIIFIDKKINNSKINNKINNIQKYIIKQNADTIILYTDYVKDYLPKYLIDNCILYNNIYYKCHKETIIILKFLYQKYFEQWKHIETLDIYI